MKSIQIAGGGVAGLSLGIALRKRKIPVEIHEAGQYPRHRVCGEFVCGVSEEDIKYLGLSEVFEPYPRLLKTAWYIGSEQKSFFQLPSTAISISRYEMDQLLADEFERLGGKLFQKSRIRRSDLSGEPGKVWTAGRPLAKNRKKWIGLKAHYKGTSLRADLELHIGKNGYVGMSPVEDDSINVCGLFRHSINYAGKGSRKLENAIRAGGMTHALDKLELSSPIENSFSSVNAIDYVGWTLDDEVVCIGDAACQIPPLTGNGMSLAMQSARAILPLIEDYAVNGLDWNIVLTDYQRTLRKTFGSRLRIARSIQNLIMNPAGRGIVGGLASTNLLPFKKLFEMTH